MTRVFARRQVEGCMKAAGESTGCEVQIEWQGDHEIFNHDEYQSASRTCKHCILS